MMLCVKMLAYKLQGDFRGPFLVLVNLFLIVVLGIRCLYTSFRAIFLLSLLMFKPVSHHAVVHQKLACKRRSGILFTVLGVCSMVSYHAVEHQMLICKQQSDVALSLSVFNTLHLFFMLCTKCLYTNFIAILVDRCLFLQNGFSLCWCAPHACIQASVRS